MYQALYRKWRPQAFSDVVGQPAITETLRAQVEKGRLSHAYLFAGSRGTGKTTCAKILSKAANCEAPINGDPCNKCPSCLGINTGAVMDVVEIDAASNNGVDGVRELRDEAVYSPANVKKRVYIIDEVHMFSNSAFNALLKILEEPPEHVLFILATTELHKVPATILSRCQRFSFKRIDSCDIQSRILEIAEKEEIEIEDKAAEFIARLADGGMRDALSIFDQCAAYGHAKISCSTVEDVIGLAGESAMEALVDAIVRRDTALALNLISDMYAGGRDLISVLSELNSYMRDMLIEKVAPNAKIGRMSTSLKTENFRKKVAEINTNRIISIISTICETNSTISASANKRIDAEICIVKLCADENKKEETVAPQGIQGGAENDKQGGFTPPAERQNTTEKPVVKVVENVENPLVSKKNELEKEVKICPLNKDTGAKKIEWKLIVEAAREELSPGLIPMLFSFTAEREANTILLFTDNQMARKLLSQRKELNILERAAEQVLNEKVSIRIAEEEKKQENDELSKLCDKLKGNEDVTIIL